MVSFKIKPKTHEYIRKISIFFALMFSLLGILKLISYSNTTKEGFADDTEKKEFLDYENEGSAFCDVNGDDPDRLNKKCNKLSMKSCKSTSCCVILPGEKCVAGDNQGPTFHDDNAEKYEFQGKCYGKC
jgi:hypothetical protein